MANPIPTRGQNFGLVAMWMLLATTRASADPPAPVSDDPLEEVVVLGHYQFLSIDTSGATDLPLPIERVPQSIGLVDLGFIKAADLKTIGDVGNYTPGAVDAG